MAKCKATVVSAGDKHYIDIALEDDIARIPLSEDAPNQVKSAFNKLLAHARTTEYTITLDKMGEDLIAQAASEYISQLNEEIAEIRAEMEELGLLKKKA